ncbi:porin [Nitrosovibrio tenuis]|uniref:Outer membrane protein (Porin) n=1 Tax=Nitrosovibrio tenuis TaxID=1233 RepID=A0A1H7LSS3_9PROT|nr:porin [Nitrosovibrio tenuis]SEL01909.1 Outer membrane protein (porin) [Nitrosovibrio tenuis]
MKKKLIALAVAGALAAPVVASAQGTNVTIFGRVQAEYSLVDFSTQHSQGGLQDNSRSSRWGLHITEDLGNGLKANARLEMGLNTGSGSATTPREQWVGLSSNQWGDVKFGRVQSPFKDFAGGMTIDPFAYTTLQANGAGGTMSGGANGLGSGANGFVNSAIRFDSANMAGFSFAALFMPGDANTLNPLNSGSITSSFLPGGLGSQGNTGGRNGDFDGQAAAKYHADFMGMGFDVFGGYSRDNANSFQRAIGLKTEEVWRVGAAWSWENLKFAGQYEQINNAIGSATCTTAASLTANPLDAASTLNPGHGLVTGQCNSAMNWGGDGNIWHAMGSYRWGNTTLVAQGGMTHANSTGGNGFVPAAQKRAADSFTVGVIHNLSKRTSIFGGYQHVYVRNGNTAAANDLPGVATDSGGATFTAPAYATGNRATYTIGLRHNF